MPHSLENFESMKASEFLHWTLFYSAPVLKPYLPEKFFQHWLLYIKSMSILTQDVITNDDIKAAELLLDLFVMQAPKLYNDRIQTYNLHQLLHYTLMVRRWGPLPDTSTFLFEHLNGVYSRLIHGKKDAGQEFINNLNLVQGMQVLRGIVRQQHANSPSNLPLGKNVNIAEWPQILKDFMQNEGIDAKEIKFYSRAKLGLNIFTSELHKDLKTNSHTIYATLEESDTIVQRIIEFFFTIEEDLYFLIKKFTVDRTKMFEHSSTETKISHILPIIVSNDFLIINVKNVKNVNFYIRFFDYVSILPSLFSSVL